MNDNRIQIAERLEAMATELRAEVAKASTPSTWEPPVCVWAAAAKSVSGNLKQNERVCVFAALRAYRDWLRERPGPTEEEVISILRSPLTNKDVAREVVDLVRERLLD